MTSDTTSKPFYRRDLVKPDGRALWLYARAPIDEGIAAVAPPRPPAAPPNPHLRWHPFRQEWVTYAGHRQQRTFLPPPDYNPLAPTSDPGSPTEMPAGAYEVDVFENLFPTLHRAAEEPARAIVETRPARGSCEVVVFTQEPSASLGARCVSHRPTSSSSTPASRTVTRLAGMRSDAPNAKRRRTRCGR